MVSERIISALKTRSPQALPGNGYKPAAVLVPIQERADGDYLVLTKRADHLSTHKGQIAFPGGRVDPGDADVTA
ncbi:MAG TPA: NUDIX domain-containing protein, partial [Candidatus Binatia bacterium]|nr:NUDIX domain-containing protein [Candidatus Binatia bacterium]